MVNGIKDAEGNPLEFPFELQFPHANVSNLSLAIVPIEQLSNDGNDTVVAHGTGFIKQYGGQFYLVTARHVLDGRNPFTGELLSPHKYEPRRFAIHPAIEFPPGSDMWRRGKTILEVSDPSDRPWFGDPAFEQLRTDIAVWPLTSLLGLQLRHVGETAEREAAMMVHAGLECMVIGFPLPPEKGMDYPVWRRGVIASEPLIPWDKRPAFLLDCSTSPGFSGAPVFRHHVGPLPYKEPDGSITVDPGAVITTALVGVYAGRLQHPHFGGEVPYVFYENRIPIIVSAACKIP